MTLPIYDRVKESSSTTGSGTISLLGAATGYTDFNSTVGNGNQTYYVIADQSGANWEVGIGTYTTSGSTLSRTTVLASSNSGSLVSFTSGTKDVFISCPAAILSEIFTQDTTGVTGILKGSSGSIVAATSGTDYLIANQTITLTGDTTGSGTTAITTATTKIGGNAVTLGGALTVSGAFTTTLTVTANTSVTLPTSGTLVNTAVTTLGSLSLPTSQLSGTIATSQIASAAVTYAKIQNVAASSLLGNPTGSAAAPSEITLGSGLSFSGSTLVASGGGSGTVTTVSVASANGFAGTVANATTTPAITLTTTITGILKGNGTAISAATSGTDYVVPAVTTLSSLVSIGTITTGVWTGTTIAVAQGGTGDTSLTAYAVLCGGTTSTGAVQSVASVGTSGQVLTSNGAGALPTFQANPAVSAISLFWMSQLAVTVANTSSITTLLDTGIGTKVVPSVIGGSDGCARIRAKGYWSTIAVSPGTITISLNASTNVLITTGAVSVPISQSNSYWEIEIDLDFNGSGINVMGRFITQGAANAQFIYGMVNTSTNGGDHMTNPLNLQVTWSVANTGNSITMFTCDFCAGIT